MVSDSIDIKALNLEELTGVVNIYPWYGGARMELCRRMSALGEGAWSEDRYAETALYVVSRRLVSDLVRSGRSVDCSDKDIAELLNGCLDAASGDDRPHRQIVVVGGDYFSQAEYESVRRSEDNVFSGFAAKAREEGYVDLPEEDSAASDFCTETLAQIYLDQGYVQEALDIYEKLLDRHPDRKGYFDAIIKQLKTK